jgi:hypothetical protein
MAAGKKVTGRPSTYSEALAAEICRRIADGETLVDLCRDPSMPHRDTIREWRRENAGFSALYAQAQQDRADHFVDRILAECEAAKAAGDTATVAAHRLTVDSLKWLASKLHPRHYGDRAAIEHSGEVAVAPLDPIDAANRIRVLLDEARKRKEGTA